MDRGQGLAAIPRQYPGGDVEHGRGILIMQAVVDEISFDITPGRGTTVRMCKELDWDHDAIAHQLLHDQLASV